MKLSIWALLAALGLVGVDQLSKYLIAQSFVLEQTKVLIPGFLQLKYVHNPGAVFGILPGYRVVFIVLVSLVLLVCIYLLVRNKVQSKLAIWAIALIIAGGAGNLIDRIIYGYVIDFILFDFSWFPFVFNVADIFVVVGGGMLLLYLLLDIRNDSQKKEDSVGTDQSGG